MANGFRCVVLFVFVEFVTVTHGNPLVISKRFIAFDKCTLHKMAIQTYCYICISKPRLLLHCILCVRAFVWLAWRYSTVIAHSSIYYTLSENLALYPLCSQSMPCLLCEINCKYPLHCVACRQFQSIAWWQFIFHAIIKKHSRSRKRDFLHISHLFAMFPVLRFNWLANIVYTSLLFSAWWHIFGSVTTYNSYFRIWIFWVIGMNL